MYISNFGKVRWCLLASVIKSFMTDANQTKKGQLTTLLKDDVRNKPLELGIDRFIGLRAEGRERECCPANKHSRLTLMVPTCSAEGRVLYH